MGRYEMKQTAKNLLDKNRWLCVFVAFLAGFTGNFSVNLTNKTNIEKFGEDSLFDIFANGSTAIINSTKDLFNYTPESLPLLILSAAITCFATYFVAEQIMTGSCRFFLKYRKDQPVDLGELFQSYKDKTFLNVAKVTFMRNLHIGLWSLLFVIPGIIKSYEYSMVKYILSVNPTIEYTKALELSKKIMRGHKLDLLVLNLSFVGWHFLSIFTFGILSVVYVAPYQRLAETEFYAHVRELAILNGVITYNDIPDYDQYVPYQTSQQYYQPNETYYNQQPNTNGFYGETQQTDPSMQTSNISTQNEEPVDATPVEETKEDDTNFFG